MSTRIPSSLVWLIDKRARLDAEIRKTQVSITNAKKLIKELSSLQNDLLAVDKTLALHEVAIDVKLIEPINSHYKRIDLPYGELTSSILSCLRIRNDGPPATKKEIIAFIVSRNPHLMTNIGVHSLLLRSVQKRLNCLVREKIIRRHHSPQDKKGLWSLIMDEEDK